MVQAILAEYQDYLPIPARQILYMGMSRFGFDKGAYEHLLDVLQRGRRAGLLPWDAIRDDGVSTDDPDGFDGVPHFWSNVAAWAEDYRRGRQLGQPIYAEVWCEAAGMMPQLARTVHPYGIPVVSCGGFDHVGPKHDAAVRIVTRTVPTVVLHVGDYDASGRAIFDSAADDVGQFVADYGAAGKVKFTEVAVTVEQIDRYDLPITQPKVKVDGKQIGGWVGGTVQAEALAPDQLADELRQAVESVPDLDILGALIATEGDEKTEALDQLARIDGGWSS